MYSSFLLHPLRNHSFDISWMQLLISRRYSLTADIKSLLTLTFPVPFPGFSLSLRSRDCVVYISTVCLLCLTFSLRSLGRHFANSNVYILYISVILAITGNALYARFWFCIFLYVYVCMIYVCVHVDTVSSCWVFVYWILLKFSKQLVSLHLELTDWLDWWASGSPGSTCVLITKGGVTMSSFLQGF